jgi:chlorobactene glucosyltransferase
MSLRLTAGVASGLWVGAAVLAAHERRRAPHPEAERPAADGPLVSVIVPARDEERGIGAAVASLRALDYPRVEVIVVDDESRDGTLAAARAAAGEDPRVRVLAGEALPPGWVGKSWACWQAVRAARGDWLLFTDADVIHAADSLGRALAMARRLGRGGVTLFPTIDCEGALERLVTPAAVTAIGTFVAPGPLARSRRSRVAIAAGGYILVERGVYESAGGHAAIRSRMVEDVCLAEAVKRGGHLLVPMPAGPLARLRMYHGGREVWDGWSKNASFAAAGSPAKGLAGAVVTVALAVIPVAAAIRGALTGDRLLRTTGGAGLLATVALQRLASRSAHTPARYAPTLPLGMLVLAGAATRGSLGRLAGRGPEWRGRRYPLAR